MSHCATITRSVTLRVAITEHADDSVSLVIRNATGNVLTQRKRISIADASVEIGAAAFEHAGGGR